MYRNRQDHLPVHLREPGQNVVEPSGPKKYDPEDLQKALEIMQEYQTTYGIQAEIHRSIGALLATPISASEVGKKQAALKKFLGEGLELDAAIAAGGPREKLQDAIRFLELLCYESLIGEHAMEYMSKIGTLLIHEQVDESADESKET